MIYRLKIWLLLPSPVSLFHTLTPFHFHPALGLPELSLVFVLLLLISSSSHTLFLISPFATPHAHLCKFSYILQVSSQMLLSFGALPLTS